MELAVHRPKILAIDVSVDLRRGNVGVAEHFLDGAKVGAALEQVGGERVPQRVRTHVLRDAGLLDVMAEDLPRSHARERRAARVEEQDALPAAFLQLWPKLAQVDGNRPDRPAPD